MTGEGNGVGGTRSPAPPPLYPKRSECRAFSPWFAGRQVGAGGQQAGHLSAQESTTDTSCSEVPVVSRVLGGGGRRCGMGHGFSRTGGVCHRGRRGREVADGGIEGGLIGWGKSRCASGSTRRLKFSRRSLTACSRLAIAAVWAAR